MKQSIGKKCTCINNFKYREHQNKYIRVAGKRNMTAFLIMVPWTSHCAGTFLVSPHHIIYLQIHIDKDYVGIIFSFPSPKRKRKERKLLFGGKECFVFYNFTKCGTLSLNYKSATFFLKQGRKRKAFLII